MRRSVISNVKVVVRDLLQWQLAPLLLRRQRLPRQFTAFLDEDATEMTDT